MSFKQLLVCGLLIVGASKLGEAAGYTKCMTDVLVKYSDNFPDSTLTLKHPNKKGWTVSVSKAKKGS